MMRTKLLLLLAMVFTLAFVGTAMGQDNATEDAYGGVLGEEVSNNDDVSPDSGGPVAVQDEDDTGTPTPVAAAQEDSLPFTGLELGLVALAGFGLVALGFAMRRSTRHAPE
ncbi:MAG TPA: hypothetical protein VNO82_25490 [Solirubrobacteraceae bacterium]|nr:hypothetical protein [Solirubrobacteraceae bacterium]